LHIAPISAIIGSVIVMLEIKTGRLLEKVGMRREARLRQNVWFHRDETGAPIWKDTFLYALLEGDTPASGA